MTKQEFINSRCEACKRCEGYDLQQFHCNRIKDISDAWDASRKQAADIGWEWVAEGTHTFDSLKESFYETLEVEL